MSQPRRAFYHPELDALRAVAFLMVFVAHAVYYVDIDWAHLKPLPFRTMFAIHGAGYYGVDLFFVLSSYLITELLLREKAQTGSIHVRQFYIRRILRIWPLYFFFLLIVLPLLDWVLPTQNLTSDVLASFLLLIGNWHCAIWGWPATVASQLWSVTVEEQFYLVWPAVMVRHSHRMVAIACGMLVGANLMRWLLVSVPHNDASIWCNTFARLDPIAGGILLASLLHRRENRLHSAARWAIGAGAVALLLLVGNFGDHTDRRALYSYPLAGLACVLLVWALLLPQGSWTPGWLGRGLIYLGKISYGLYVYHLLAFEAVKSWRPQTPVMVMAEALVISIALAALSYHFLERPFLRFKKQFTFVASRDSLV